MKHSSFLELPSANCLSLQEKAFRKSESPFLFAPLHCPLFLSLFSSFSLSFALSLSLNVIALSYSLSSLYQFPALSLSYTHVYVRNTRSQSIVTCRRLNSLTIFNKVFNSSSPLSLSLSFSL